jgi:hypothetical protein
MALVEDGRLALQLVVELAHLEFPLEHLILHHQEIMQ